MGKYGLGARRIINKTMDAYRDGRLTSGRNKRQVQNRKQALAIGFSRARAYHYKVPNGGHH